MPRDEALSVGHVDRLAGFKVEDDLMFGAVVFENAVDVFGPGEQEQKNKKDGEADQSVNEVEENLAFDNRCPIGNYLG